MSVPMVIGCLSSQASLGGYIGQYSKSPRRRQGKKYVATEWTHFGHRAFSADFYQLRAGVTGSVLVERKNEYLFSVTIGLDT